MKRHWVWLLSLVVMGSTAFGCTKTPPPVTAAEGTVILDGKPLPHALVQFMPDTTDFGAELNSMGVTDAEGHFKLTCTKNNEAGAVIGKHKVVVTEGPVPAEIKRNQEKVTEFTSKLKNRPIPANYGSFTSTPITVEVTTGQKDYAVKMVRTAKPADSGEGP